jgi:crotonobetainyl-CoA:carnitine CoA-transferase CaiB-like acyl-CoA transferase
MQEPLPLVQLTSASPSHVCWRYHHPPQVIEGWVAAHSSAEVMAAMQEARVPAGPILSIADIAAEAQYQQRGMIQKARPPAGAPTCKPL